MKRKKKIRLPHWKGLHMDCSFYWSELFKLNNRLFKKSHNFNDFCRRIHGGLGAHMAKHKWAAAVFTACKLGKFGLAKTLAFPEASRFSELFDSNGKPNAAVAAWLKDNMLSDLSYYFEAISRTDGILITAQYSQIIGSRWLALLPTSEPIPNQFKRS